jgi:hypothetical protein
MGAIIGASVDQIMIGEIHQLSQSERIKQEAIFLIFHLTKSEIRESP